MTTYGLPLPPNDPTAIGVRWWDEELSEEDRATALFNHARDIEQRHEEVHVNNLLYAQLYSNRELPSFDWGYGVDYDPSLSPVSRLSENLALSVVDTFVSQIGKNRPKPSVVLRGAPWRLRRAAKMMDRWLYGCFLNQDAFEKGKSVYCDAAVFGFGCLRVGIVADQLRIERVFPDDILVDQRECYGDRQPVHVFIRHVMTTATAVATYGLDELAVTTASAKPYIDYRGVGRDHVVVIEGWRRAQRKHNGELIPGAHFIALDGVPIQWTEYKEEWLPLVFYRWQDPRSGFYSPSAVEQVLPYQIRLNEINDVIRDAQDLMGRPRILVPEGAKININQLDNQIGKFIRYSGAQKPEAINWTAVSAELYGERDRLVKSCYEFLGMSQLSAQSKLPNSARLDSSAALQMYNDIEDGRFADMAQRYEQFYLDLAETIIRVVQKEGVDVSATWWRGGRKGASVNIKWEEIDLDRDQYVLTLEPSSIVNQTPAGRRDELDRWLQQGLITPGQYAQHYANPDLEGLASLAAAIEEHTDHTIELIETGGYRAPSQLDTAPDVVARVHMAFLALDKWEVDDQDKSEFEAVKNSFVGWLLHARSILDEAQESTPTLPGAQPMMGAPGMGAPMAPTGGAPMGQPPVM